MIGVSLAIIGLGPFARHIHLAICSSFDVIPKLIVDLEGVDFSDYPQKFPEANFARLPRDHRFGFQKDDPAILGLIEKIREHQITHVILSSEPLAHEDYLHLFHELHLDVICDKPVLVKEGIDHDLHAVKKLSASHDKLLELYSRPGSPKLQINLDMRNSKEHESILKKATSYGETNDALPESLSIFYAGGNWCMPGEISTREGHPFKYGYGTLFHTAFHYVDFIAIYLKRLMTATKDHVIGIDVLCVTDRPQDVVERMGKRRGLDLESSSLQGLEFENLGSMNVHYLIRVKTKRGRTTKIDLELLTCGLSTRTNPAPPLDNYRGAGRIKTENMRLAISPDCFLLLEDIRASNETTLRLTSVERANDKLELTVKDYLTERGRSRAPSLIFNFFMGAHDRNPQITTIKDSLKLFEILIESNTLANLHGGTSSKSYIL